MLACRVLITDRLRAQDNPGLWAVIEKQVVDAMERAGGRPELICWLEEETSYDLEFPPTDGDKTGRYRVYFEAEGEPVDAPLRERQVRFPRV